MTTFRYLCCIVLLILMADKIGQEFVRMLEKAIQTLLSV